MAGDEGDKDVFKDDADRKVWLDQLAEVCGSHGWRIHAYLLMGNHFHLLLETPEPDLVAGMKRRKGSIRGAARAHDKAETERLAKAGMVWLGLPGRAEDLVGRGEGVGGEIVACGADPATDGGAQRLGGGAARHGGRVEPDRGPAAGQGAAGADEAASGTGGRTLDLNL